jgi:hypothetical protein
MALLMPGTPLRQAADVTSGQNDEPRIPSLWPAPLAPLSHSHVGKSLSRALEGILGQA